MKIICFFILVVSIFTMMCISYFNLNKMYTRYSEEIYSQLQNNAIAFNKDMIFKYEDLSKKYQRKISKKDYAKINTVQEASSFFNSIQSDVNELPTRKMITGPVYGTSIYIDGETYSIAYEVLLGVEWFKPVILKCNIYIYP